MGHTQTFFLESGSYLLFFFTFLALFLFWSVQDNLSTHPGHGVSASTYSSTVEDISSSRPNRRIITMLSLPPPSVLPHKHVSAPLDKGVVLHSRHPSRACTNLLCTLPVNCCFSHAVTTSVNLLVLPCWLRLLSASLYPDCLPQLLRQQQGKLRSRNQPTTRPYSY